MLGVFFILFNGDMGMDKGIIEWILQNKEFKSVKAKELYLKSIEVDNNKGEMINEKS